VTRDPWHRITTASDISDLVNEIESRNNEKNRREAQKFQLSLFHTWFVDKGNPLYVWAAVKYCADKELHLPEWVIESLTRTADDLLKIARTTAPGDAPKAALKALGLSVLTGKESPFQEFELATKRELVCLSFARKILSGAPHKQARWDVANESEKVSIQTVDSWLRDFYPDKRGDLETWGDFFRRKTNLEGPDYDKLLASLLYFQASS
jgi:hypothetical protein